MTVYVKRVVRFNVHKTLPMLYIERTKTNSFFAFQYSQDQVKLLKKINFILEQTLLFLDLFLVEISLFGPNFL